jgi:drug/metabolite transporter (DMT)-like permease
LGGLTTITYYQALKTLPAALAIVLLFQFTWLLPLVGWVVGGQKPNRSARAAIGVVLMGTLLAVGPALKSFGSLIGWGFGVASALTYALMLWASGQFAKDTPLWSRSWRSTLAAAATVWLVYHPVQLGQLWARNLWWGTVIGVFSQTLPLLFIFQAAPRLSPAITAILASFELPIAVWLSFWWLREPVPLTEWLGVALIVGGVAWSVWA